jgi:hypothetical protein
MGLVGVVGEIHAQPIGTFRWQLAPYCNVLTLTVTQSGAIYTLDGSDVQCGPGQRASAVGTAFANPDGSIGAGTLRRALRGRRRREFATLAAS